MEVSRILMGTLFVVVGVVLTGWIMVTKLKLEKEVKEGKTFNMHKLLPFWNADDFTEQGNSLRKTYNNLYYVLIVYSVALYVFMQSNESCALRGHFTRIWRDSSPNSIFSASFWVVGSRIFAATRQTVDSCH